MGRSNNESHNADGRKVHLCFDHSYSQSEAAINVTTQKLPICAVKPSVRSKRGTIKCLSKPERTEHQRQQNRKSAKTAREKQRATIAFLQEKVNTLTKENERLQCENCYFKNANFELLQENGILSKRLNGMETKMISNEHNFQISQESNVNAIQNSGKGGQKLYDHTTLLDESLKLLDNYFDNLPNGQILLNELLSWKEQVMEPIE